MAAQPLGALVKVSRDQGLAAQHSRNLLAFDTGTQTQAQKSCLNPTDGCRLPLLHHSQFGVIPVGFTRLLWATGSAINRKPHQGS